MWRAEVRLNMDLYSVMESEDLKSVIRNSVSEARGLGIGEYEQIWITIRKDDGYTRFVINVDRNFVCYKNTDSDYVLINAREGSVFNV